MNLVVPYPTILKIRFLVISCWEQPIVCKQQTVNVETQPRLTASHVQSSAKRRPKLIGLAQVGGIQLIF